MMTKTRTLISLTLTIALGIVLNAQERVRIGLLPFDVASVDGGTYTAAAALAKLVRAQMITEKRVQPILLELPAGAKMPLSEKQLTALTAENDLHTIVSATVLEADTSRDSNCVYSGGLGGRIGTSVGGSVTRTRARVKMHVELSGPNGEVTDAFEVEGSNTDVGVGTDIWTTLGGFDVGDRGWDKSPMGKALKEAAEKLAAETVSRTSKR